MIPLRSFLFPLAVLALAGSGFIARADEEAGLAAPEGGIPVTVSVARRGSPSRELTLPATLEAFQDTGIYARTGGYLARWTADLGDHVKAGQLLAVIDAPELDQELNSARAKLAQARANLELAKSSAVRWEDLSRQNAVAKQEVDEKEGALAAREADVQAADAEVSRLGQLKSYQSITAPFDGVITARNTDVGMLVTPGGGRELFHIAQTDPLRVDVGVPQSHIRAIQPGMVADVLLTEFPDRAFPGKVARAAGALDPRTRTMLTEVQIPNPQGELFAGMFVEVRFKLMQSVPAIVVPSAALQIGSEGAQVAVINSKNQIHWQKVKLGRDFGAQVEIASGLNDGDRMVATPSDAMVEGQLVAPIAPAAPKKK